MGNRSVLRLLVLIAAATAAARVVPAQYTSVNGIKWDNPHGAALDTSLTFAIQNGVFAARELRAAAEPVLCFTPAAKPVVAQAMAEKLGRTDEERKQLATAFIGILRSVEEECRKDPDENNPHDLAKAYAWYVASNYSVLHPRFEIDRGVMVGLIRQFRTALMDAAEAKTVSDEAKQSVWESLVILGGFAAGGYGKSVEEGDQETATAMQGMARAALKALLKVDADEVVLLPGKKFPLGFTRKARPVTPDANGELRVRWLAFKLPKGWKAEQSEDRLILTPGDLAKGESLAAIASPAGDDVNWQNAEYFAWRAVTGKEIYDAEVEFPNGLSKSSVLENGWAARVHVGKLKPGGWATVLILQRTPKDPILFLLVIGSGPEVVNRYNQKIIDAFTRGAREVKEEPRSGKD